jgi:RNA polymerase sigma-70 factor (ECF subfamily)
VFAAWLILGRGKTVAGVLVACLAILSRPDAGYLALCLIVWAALFAPGRRLPLRHAAGLAAAVLAVSIALPALGPDLAARVSREEVGRAIKGAFARAVAELAPRQRNFLRHAHVDQLTLDQIAATYGIHRATVARTLAGARADLVAATRAALAAQLGVDPASLDSVVREADSRMDLSLSRVLRAPEPADPGAGADAGADADADAEAP